MNSGGGDVPQGAVRTRDSVVAIVGCGNIGGAIIEGLVATSGHHRISVIACDLVPQRVQDFTSSLGVKGSNSIAEIVPACDTIVVAVKPKQIWTVLEEIRKAAEFSKNYPVVCSVVAGVSTPRIYRVLSEDFHLVRAMPNLPCLIGEGMTVLYSPSLDDTSAVEEIFRSIGETVTVEDEGDLDAVTGLSGSGPAFVFMMIEALADGGVRMGLNRQIAQKIAAQMVYGSAGLVLQSGLHPGELKDMVASPGGTTIAGIQSLEKDATRGAFISAVEAATKRARKLMGREEKGGE